MFSYFILFVLLPELDMKVSVFVLSSAQALQDPGVYGVIQSGDHKGRTCVVKWIKLNSAGDDVEVSEARRRNNHYYNCVLKTVKVIHY